MPINSLNDYKFDRVQIRSSTKEISSIKNLKELSNSNEQHSRKMSDPKPVPILEEDSAQPKVNPLLKMRRATLTQQIENQNPNP